MLSIYFFLIQISQIFDSNLTSPMKSRHAGNIELQIASVKRNVKNNSCFDASVLIINNTDTVASFFEDWNMWGWFNIRFKIKTRDSVFFIYKEDRDWTKNFPSCKTLFPGDTMELKYTLRSGAGGYTPFERLSINHYNELISLQAFYKFDKLNFQGALDPDSLLGYHYLYTRIYKRGHSIIIDSLKHPIQVIRTFTTTPLQSNEYILTN